MGWDFNRVPGTKNEYPKRDFSANENQAYGFLQAFKLQTGNTRGTQTVGYGDVKIDGANNRITVGNIILDGNTDTITVTNDDGTGMGMGVIPNTDPVKYGLFFTDASGRVVQAFIGPTRFIYNPDTGQDISQDGRLPDGTYARADAKPGQSVSGAITP